MSPEYQKLVSRAFRSWVYLAMKRPGEKPSRLSVAVKLALSAEP